MLDANTWCTRLRYGGLILHENGWRIASTISTFGITHCAGRPPRGRVGRRPHFGWFAMEETAGTKFLKSLTGIIQDGGRSIPATLQLPSFGSIGFGLGGESGGRIRDDADYQYALFRDGLALLGDPHRGRFRGITMWSPKEGILPQ
jgi:hypothetical protein